MKKKVIKKPTKKKLTYAKLLKKADDVFSKWIRNRDGYKCVICGSTERIQNGHCFKRGKKRLRFDEHNCNAICSSCNYRDNFEHDHYVGFMLKKYGQEEYMRLLKISEIKDAYKIPRYELEELIERYK